MRGSHTPPRFWRANATRLSDRDAQESLKTGLSDEGEAASVMFVQDDGGTGVRLRKAAP